jgi:metal-responsive CopG/Arc/MetJ family transcriptional regulator
MKDLANHYKSLLTYVHEQQNEEKVKKVSVNLTDEIVDRLDTIGSLIDMDRSSFIRMILRHGIREIEKDVKIDSVGSMDVTEAVEQYLKDNKEDFKND